MHDAVVAGGGISGLLCAREAASAGLSVLVLESGHEVGTPEHCSGLVSRRALEALGLEPRAVESKIERAALVSPSGRRLELDARKQEVLCVDRRALDKQAAAQAQDAGAEIRVGSPATSISANSVRSRGKEFECRTAIDARGSAVLREAVPSAQCEVRAEWAEGPVEVHVDQSKYPGFFAWVIPTGGGRAKVGAAGRGIDASAAVDSFLSARGKHSVLRRVLAPVWVGGPLRRFSEDGVIKVGDAAGQTKPTTAGGIYSCGMGGALAGRAAAAGDASAYEAEWRGAFGAEFAKQLSARRALEKMSNRTVERAFSAVRPGALRRMSESGDFDFHAASLVSLLGVRGSLGTAASALSDRLRGNSQ